MIMVRLDIQLKIIQDTHKKILIMRNMHPLGSQLRSQFNHTADTLHVLASKIKNELNSK